MNKDSVLEAIKKAFPKRALSQSEIKAWKDYVALFDEMVASEEADAFKAYGLKPWHTIPDDLIVASFASVHALPHVAFNYYLPRLMVAALDQPFDLSMERIVVRLLDSSYSMNSLSLEQRKAIATLCDFYSENHFFNNDYVAKNMAALVKLLSAS